MQRFFFVDSLADASLQPTHLPGTCGMNFILLPNIPQGEATHGKASIQITPPTFFLRASLYPSLHVRFCSPESGNEPVGSSGGTTSTPRASHACMHEHHSNCIIQFHAFVFGTARWCSMINYYFISTTACARHAASYSHLRFPCHADIIIVTSPTSLHAVTRKNLLSAGASAECHHACPLLTPPSFQDAARVSSCNCPTTWLVGRILR